MILPDFCSVLLFSVGIVKKNFYSSLQTSKLERLSLASLLSADQLSGAT
jgi:hypothetical protein